MKKLIRLVLVSALLAGCSPSKSNISSSLDSYKIQWTGSNGAELFGSYGIKSQNPGTPTKLENFTKTVPYEVSFSTPHNTLVSASGLTLNQSTVEIKIFKNGSECGKATMVGSGAMANKVC